MASLYIKAENLGVGDVMFLPFGKTATVKKVGPIGPRTRYVQIWTEHGRSRIEVGTEVHVQARVI